MTINFACRGLINSMSLDIDPGNAHALHQWAAWFKGVLAPTDLSADGVLAFMHHFADLGILESDVDEDKWKLSGVDSDSNRENIRKQVLERLETLSRTPAGFAVSCFLGRPPEFTSSSKETSPPVRASGPKVNESPPNREIASDLSNLQIVKKVGRQLQPFLELEKNIVSRLLGTHTQTKEARVIFNYILRHTQSKAEPKKWEQLSRKRHK